MSTPTGRAPDTDFSRFEAYTGARTGSFELDMPPGVALPLFTAPGERLWVTGWEPHILHGDGFEVGTVWVTEDEGATSYWYVAVYDTTRGHARYVRVTPGAHTGTVDVRVTAAAGGARATVSVAYCLTGLSEAGNDSVRAMLEAPAYAQMLQQWRQAIEDNSHRIAAHAEGAGASGHSDQPIEQLADKASRLT
jgi:hypothetical protein